MKKLSYSLAIVLVLATAVFWAVSKIKQPRNGGKFQPMPRSAENASQGPAVESDPNGSRETIVPDWLLPDLAVKPLAQAYLVSGSAGEKILRFPASFMNTGDGPLDLVGTLSPESSSVRAIQRIHYRNGTTEERLAGNFVFHPTHDHWHFENFAEFELWSLKGEKELDERLRSTGKMTFCIHDYAPLPDDFPGQPAGPVYPWCDLSVDIQGISVGWMDTYLADVPGQELDITGLADGTYAFRAVVDPENRLVEKHEDNNSSVSFLAISGNSVHILPRGPAK